MFIKQSKQIAKRKEKQLIFKFLTLNLFTN